MNVIPLGMCRSDILKVRDMCCAISLLGLSRANFVYSQIIRARGATWAHIPFVSQVILGSNGSGKSTILKLVTRLYDPTEGTILIDGQDIKILRLEGLRRATAILFQDFTLFPLTVRSAHPRAILGSLT
jgi:ABC-type transport system involved in Fe-S cluster assembly fused permease/ATPase subunit